MVAKDLWLTIVVHIVSDIGTEGDAQVKSIELELGLQTHCNRSCGTVVDILIVIVNLTILVTVDEIMTCHAILIGHRLGLIDEEGVCRFAYFMRLDSVSRT